MSYYTKLNDFVEKNFGENGILSCDEETLNTVINLRQADRLAKRLYGEFGFATLSDDEAEEIINDNPELIKVDLKEGRWFSRGRTLRETGRSSRLRIRESEELTPAEKKAYLADFKAWSGGFYPSEVPWSGEGTTVRSYLYNVQKKSGWDVANELRHYFRSIL